MSVTTPPISYKDTLLYRLAKAWIRGVAGVAGLLEVGIASAALGISELPKRIPALDFARQNPVNALAAGGILFGMSFTSWIITRRADRGMTPLPTLGPPRLPKGVLVATTVSTVSMLLFVSLLATVLLRPSWCPSQLCPPAIQVVVHHPGSAFDDRLEVYPIGAEIAHYELAGDAATASVTNPPRVAACQRRDRNCQIRRTEVAVLLVDDGDYEATALVTGPGGRSAARSFMR